VAVRITWNGEALKRYTHKQIEAGLYAAAVELHRIARKKASIPNAGQTVAVKRQRAGGNKSSRTIYPHSSRPGESPRRRTGFGQKNIVFGISQDGTTARVGYTRNARYMTYHELGIRYSRVGLQYRPTIVPAMRHNAPRLAMIAVRAARETRP